MQWLANGGKQKLRKCATLVKSKGVDPLSFRALSTLTSPRIARSNLVSSPLSVFENSRLFGTVPKEEGLKKKERDLQLALVTAAADGNLNEVKRLVEAGANVDIGTHDKRSPLHLAAAENKPEVCAFLIEKGAKVNAVDRFNRTPLEAALSGKHGDLVKFLRSKGAAFTMTPEIAYDMCQEASKGNIAGMQMLFDAGADVNAADYDLRTPVHLASSEGQVQAVEWLIKHGSNVNVTDRFGNTPLQDAERGRGRHYRAVVQVLKENGASLTKTVNAFGGPELLSSISASLPLLCERGGFIYAEAWLPAREGTEFEFSSWYGDKESAERLGPFAEDVAGSIRANDAKSLLSRVCSTGKALALPTLSEADLKERFAQSQRVGLSSGAVVPVIHEGKVCVLLSFFAAKKTDLAGDEFDRFASFSSSLIAAGVFGTSRVPQFAGQTKERTVQMEEVFRRIVAEGVFSPAMVFSEVDWFFNMGMQSYYFNRFSTAILANHVHSYIAAKKFAQTTGDPENIFLHIENNERLLGGKGPEQLLYMVPVDHSTFVDVERNIEQRIALIPHTKPYTFEYFSSERPATPRGSKKLGIYVLQTQSYANPSKVGTKETNIWEVASDVFLRDKTKAVRERYQEIVRESLTRLSPVCRQYETYRDGTIPLMFAFSQGAGTSTSYMLQLTELMHQSGLVATRKFIETFANGVIVFSLYLNPAPKDKITLLLKQFSMLHLVPESALSPLFLSGQYTAEKYTYSSAASRVIYYFINQRNEEFDTLAKVFGNDPLNLSRLRLLHTTLKREAVSQSRIHTTLQKHPAIIEQLFEDFITRVTTDQIKNPIGDTANAKLARLIKNSCTSDLDAQILMAMLDFNNSVLKTNMYKQKKSALSFRLKPSLLEKAQGAGDWPQIPFALFFVMGSDFQGFHVRFHDVARGGIRLIFSRDAAAYTRNLATQFAENYGLAYTQNKKNKDIPEFGSKGTILLNPNSQGNGFLAFQKYTSGMLDLLIKHEDIVDNYGKQELLFFGPDEGTADFMEWACLYAQRKGYAYWRSFTTGKPPSLGGIPHDRFGMTTRSVHKYVLACLKKCGLDESQVTKIQTGGPDGDLGSNEILLSKDKTKAVVDGSGVLYDPSGINRTELTRLAVERKMVDHFDVKMLGPGGFRVLVNENDVVLPNGELVEKGITFRNEFHLHPLATADLFVPCGGRPEAVNLGNVRKLLNEDGTPRFKIVVEGANLFFTQDARMVLEEAGVILYKDASTNKGGVTSSSLEVLAALSLSDSEFSEHMAVTDLNAPPRFYSEYVKEIQHRVEQDAELEFECIWKEHEQSKIHRYHLTDMVSDKINNLNLFITASPLFSNVQLRHTVLYEAIPRKLTDLVGLENILQRVPENYLRAIFGAYLASRYVYKHGINANEFAFFEFMQPFLQARTISLAPIARSA